MPRSSLLGRILPPACAAAALLASAARPSAAQANGCAAAAPIPASVRPLLDARRDRDRSAHRFARPFACDADFAPPTVRIVSGAGRGTTPVATVRFTAADGAGLDPSPAATLDGAAVPVQSAGVEGGEAAFAVTVQLTPDRPHTLEVSVWDAAGNRATRRALLSYDASGRMPLVRAGSFGSQPVNSSTGAAPATEAYAGSAAAPAPDLLPNAGTTVERSLCLAVSVGAGAASECGDLRLVHPLPAVRTYNRSRGAALLYNSQLAHPHPLVTAQVTVPAGAGTPATVTATLTVGGVQRQSRSWGGSDFPPGAERQVVLDFDALDLPTGVYPYTVEVTSWYGGVPYPSQVQGELAIVNRSDSHFGAGWWLAGWEGLYFIDNHTRLLWVGGDGSTRVYSIAGSWGTWTAPTLDRPDTITYGSTAEYTGYTRKLPGGAKILYNGAGVHEHTEDRLHRRTTFLYDGNTGALTVVKFPSPVRAWMYDYSYVFVNGSPGGRMSSVVLYAGNQSRTVEVTCCMAEGQPTRIVDPGGDTTWIGTYAGGVRTRRITQVNFPGNRVVDYTYDAGFKLRTVRVEMRGTTADLVTTLVPQETRGMGGPPLPMDSVYTLLDGPRADAADITKFWVDRWGHPWKTRNALGHEAMSWRTDARFPALFTVTQAPNGLVTRAWYDARGNVDSTRVENPLGDGRHAVTRYTYGNAAWPDFVTRITLPHGEITDVGYDSAGNRAWQQDGRGAVSRVTFGYDALGLPAWVRDPYGRADSVRYDARANPHATRSALGFWSLAYADDLGRDTLSITPTDSASTATDSAALKTAGVRTRTVYDDAGRPLLTQTIGPATVYPRTYTGVPEVPGPLTLSVRNVYDHGLLVRTDRWSTPDSAHVDTLTTRWRYDPAGRKVAELAPTSPDSAERRDSTVYDPAGNVVRTIDRLGQQVTMQYDELGRLVQRTLPATAGAGPDVETFTYDEMGRMRSALNSAARVRRGYLPGGALAADTLEIATESFAWGRHLYLTRYGYDLEGRRTTMTVPDSVAPSSTQKQFQYAYDPVTGALRTVTDPLGNVTTFAQRLDGALDTLRLPGAITETYAYDADGQMTRRLRTQTAGGWAYPLYADTTVYTARGKVAYAAQLDGNARMHYDGLGHLVHSFSHDAEAHTGQDSEEEYRYDALGNALWHRNSAYTTQSAPPTGPIYPVSQYYQRWTGRHYATLKAADETLQGALRPRADAFRAFDAAGNLKQNDETNSVRLLYGATAIGTGGSRPRIRTLYAQPDESQILGAVTGVSDGMLSTSTVYGYRGDGRLVSVNRTAGCVYLMGQDVCASQVPDYTSQTRLETYRYDALGRRVWVKTVTPGTGAIGQCSFRCDNTTRRTIWDGDQVLAEIRYPNGQGEQDSGLDSANVAALGEIALRPTTQAGHAYGGKNTSDWAQHGRVLYVHAGGIDQPLGLIRMDYSHTFPAPVLIVPHANWRGMYEQGTVVANQVCRDVW
ncbi:MAG TPA: hypothetical protein VFJ82_23955, partial [Longimicrobium sp.]|nr:hypothetical protein [Longimicrobium sp.]